MDEREFVEPPLDVRTSLAAAAAFGSDQTLLFVVLGLTVVGLALSLLIVALRVRDPLGSRRGGGDRARALVNPYP